MTDDVSVRFGAQIAGLVSGVGEVKEQIEGLTRPVAEVVEVMKGLGEAAIAAFAIEEISEFIEHVSELGEQMERTAQMTGLSIDAIQQFQFAVQMSGGDAQSAAIGIEHLERNIQDAANNTGNAAAVFKSLGISVLDAQKQIRPLQDIMGDIAEKFSTAADGVTKTNDAFILMGRSGPQLIPVFDKGREGLAELNEELEHLGGKVAPASVQALTDLHESTLKVGTAWKGLEENWTADAAPAFTSINNFIAQTIVNLRNLNLSAKDAFSDLPGGALGAYVGSHSAEGAGSGGENYHVPFGPFQPLPSPKPEGKSPDFSEALSDIATDQQLAKLRLDTQKSILQQEVAAKQQTKEEEIELEKQFTDQAFAVDMDALDQKLVLYQDDAANFEKTLNQELILEQQHTAAIAKLDAQMAQAQASEIKKTEAQWKALTGVLDTTFKGMLTGVLQGTQTWQQAMAQAFSDLAISAIESIAEIIGEWLLFEIVTEGQGTWSDFMALEGKGSSGLGKFLGSFDTGSWSLPSDGLAMVHQGEMIVPAAQAQSIRDGGSLGGDIHLHVHAMDAASVKKLFMDNGPTLAASLRQQMRNFNPNVPA